MRIKLSLALRLAVFGLAALSATGALVAAGLNDPSTLVASIGCGQPDLVPLTLPACRVQGGRAP